MRYFLTLLLFCLLSSCRLLDSDRGQNFSYNDPLFLGVNDLAIACSSSSKLSYETWKGNYQDLLDTFRVAPKKFDFKGLQSQRGELCNLTTYLQEEPNNFESFSPSKKLAYWMNTYQILIIDLIVQGYREVNEVGKPSKPEFRSPLNIKNKGLAIFREFKWLVHGAYLSLDNIESRIDQLGGVHASIALYRGMAGFAPLYDFVLEESNTLQYIEDNNKKIVNEEIFYDNFGETSTAFLPGYLDIYRDLFTGGEIGLREFLRDNLDASIWGSFDSHELVEKNDDGKFKWVLSFDPVNWQLAE